MAINIEEVLERAFEQAFLKALEQTVQVKAEELFRKALTQGSPLSQKLQEKWSKAFNASSTKEFAGTRRSRASKSERSRPPPRSACTKN